MTLVERFADYARAFELTLDDDDWGRLEPYFTETAAYHGGPEIVHGRDAVLRQLRGSVDSLDRRMDQRTLDFQPFTADGNTVSFDWTVTYARDGCPDLVVVGHEVAVFDGDRIAELRDEYTPEMLAAFRSWLKAYGSRLRDPG